MREKLTDWGKEWAACAKEATHPDERTVKYLCVPKGGGAGVVIDRAPDSFELRDCEITALKADETSISALVKSAIQAANRGGDIATCSLAAAHEIASLYTAPVTTAAAAQPKPYALRFPAVLRKMWSGSEVQAWLDQLPPLYGAPLVANPAIGPGAQTTDAVDLAEADERAAFVDHQGYDRPETECSGQEAWDYHRATRNAALAFAAHASASQASVDNVGAGASELEVGKAPSLDGPLERPFHDVMAEISTVRPLVDQFIQSRAGEMSGIGYADLLAFASTVHRETLSSARGAARAHRVVAETPDGEQDL